MSEKTATTPAANTSAAGTSAAGTPETGASVTRASATGTRATGTPSPGVYYQERNTLETKIQVTIDLNRDFQESKINTGIGFFNHMLTLFAFHSQTYLDVQTDGDLEVDGHHTVEDIGIVMGELIRQIYKDRGSYQRYGSFYMPMDECLARVVIDLSGRPYLAMDAEFSRDTVGQFATELVREFFYALAINARLTLHIDLLKTGNTHHEIEAIFKAFARALKIALAPASGGVPSSKGVIQ
ncbi:Imidazoleglycerol-phosphate dehydratase [Actinobaculum suis]|uniref:Imidazoleglycerol-phosphate dehydratase n=1 Tax=Actinobaculum suis TaxID=1657 RepID=A0A7Z9C8P9_9ACTO|nr:imidazoleglycerol-phosphate dehydratase HisB [Actinobaculum suis]VDG76695.1 Imidazoleglycerol-phosphate dehydratase [Actinobaculum suis]